MVAVAVAGCAPGDAPEATVDLTQQVYVGVAVGEASPDHAVLQWAIIEPGGPMVGYDGCNSMTAELGDDRQIRPMLRTDAGCPGREPAIWVEGALGVADGGNTITIPVDDGRTVELRALIDSAPSVSLAGSWALSGDRVLTLSADGSAEIAACGRTGTWTEGDTVTISVRSMVNDACMQDTWLFHGEPLEVSDAIGISGVVLHRPGRPTEGPYAVQLARRVADPTP